MVYFFFLRVEHPQQLAGGRARNPWLKVPPKLTGMIRCKVNTVLDNKL